MILRSIFCTTRPQCVRIGLFGRKQVFYVDLTYTCIRVTPKVFKFEPLSTRISRSTLILSICAHYIENIWLTFGVNTHLHIGLIDNHDLHIDYHSDLIICIFLIEMWVIIL